MLPNFKGGWSWVLVVQYVRLLYMICSGIWRCTQIATYCLHFQDIIAEVPGIIARCISRDEAALAVAQKVCWVLRFQSILVSNDLLLISDRHYVTGFQGVI